MQRQQQSKNVTNPNEKQLWLTSHRHNSTTDLNKSDDVKTRPMKSLPFIIDTERKYYQKKQYKNFSKNDVLANHIEKLTTPSTTSTPNVVTQVMDNVTESQKYYRNASTTEINQLSLTTPSTSPATTTEYSIVYNVTQLRGQVGRRPVNKSQTKSFRYSTLTNSIWGRWQKWTKCSRSCGGGVMSQTRHCLSRYVHFYFIQNNVYLMLSNC